MLVFGASRGNSSTLRAIDLQGNLLWEKPMPGGRFRNNPPVIDADGRIYVAFAKSVYAFDANGTCVAAARPEELLGVPDPRRRKALRRTDQRNGPRDRRLSVRAGVIPRRARARPSASERGGPVELCLTRGACGDHRVPPRGYGAACRPPLAESQLKVFCRRCGTRTRRTSCRPG